MASKRTRLFLYLAVACFIGIIAIFVVDGYMGVYETIYVTAGEQEQRIDPDFWLGQGPPGLDTAYYIGASFGSRVFFRYEVANRRFSRYSASLEVSVWRTGEKVFDVTSQSIAVGPLGKGEAEWSVDTARLSPDETLPPGESFSVVIKRGEIERRIIINLYPVASPLKPVPAG